MLTFVLFAFAEALDPKYFKCYPNSPTDSDVFSDGDPPVNLVHIFCGQINKYGQAIGFHSRPNGIDPPCAKTESYWYEYQEEFPLSYDDHANFQCIGVGADICSITTRFHSGMGTNGYQRSMTLLSGLLT